jgi:hypothetical protein
MGVSQMDSVKDWGLIAFSPVYVLWTDYVRGIQLPVAQRHLLRPAVRKGQTLAIQYSGA